MEFGSIADIAQIVIADIVLSGDNALIIGLAASSLPPEMRARAILFGMVMAAVLRIVFAVFATYLLSVQGLLFLGGLLLLWVCWRLYKEIRAHTPEEAAEVVTEVVRTTDEAGGEPVADASSGGSSEENPSRASVFQAFVSITVADVSMSIDNVLAVAAIARDNVTMLVFGLALAIALMGFCATIIVKILARYPAISWLGLVVLVYVSGRMLWEGWPDFASRIGIV